MADVVRLTFAEACRAWTRIHAMVLLMASVLSWQLGAAWPLVAAGLPSFVALLTLASRLRSAPGFGAANLLTTFRLGLVGLLGLGVSALPAAVLGGVALAVLLMDGVDGWLARRLGEDSELGALFDMEVDALFVLVLGFVLLTRDLAGAFVLFGGLLRPLYVICLWMRPVVAGAQPRSNFGRVAFVAFALGSIVPLFVQGLPAVAAAALGSSLVALSFARGFAAWLSSPSPPRPFK